MLQCKAKGCTSYALNDDPESGLCDVCLYKIPLFNLLACIHQDSGQFTTKYGLNKSIEDAYKIIANAVVK